MINWQDITHPSWLSLIGRPRLSILINGKRVRCGNITCGKTDLFKKYKDNIYLCKCGFQLSGEFETITHKTKLKCTASKCPESKTKMDKECLKCKYIIEV